MADPTDDFVIEHPVSIRHKVYEYLRNEILSNRISGGTRLVEGQLAKKINVSRTPIREALHILEMENLVESFPRVSYRVKELRWEDEVVKEDEKADKLRGLIKLIRDIIESKEEYKELPEPRSAYL